MRNLLARERKRLLADELGDLVFDRQVAPLLGREVRRALGQELDELVAQGVDPVAGLRAHRMERVEVAELGGRVHLGRDVARLQPVDLVQRDHDRHSEREHPLCDEPVTRADPLARREDEQHRVDVLERLVDGALHPLGHRVERALEAGQVDEHELVVLAVRDARDAAPRRLRLVGDDRDLAARERVDERRLADVRPAGDCDEARLHRSKVSGRSSSGVLVTTSPSAFLYVTRSKRNS